MSRQLTKKTLKRKRKAEKVAARRKLIATVEKEQDQSTKFRAAEYAKLHGGRQIFDQYVRCVKRDIAEGKNQFVQGFFTETYNATQDVFDLTTIADWCIEDEKYVGPELFASENSYKICEGIAVQKPGFYIRRMTPEEVESQDMLFDESHYDAPKTTRFNDCLVVTMVIQKVGHQLFFPILFIPSNDLVTSTGRVIQLEDDGTLYQYTVTYDAKYERASLKQIKTKGMYTCEYNTMQCMYWLQKLTQASNVEMSYIPESRPQTYKRIVQGLPKYKFGFIDIGMAQRPADGVGKTGKTGRKLPLHKKRAHLKIPRGQDEQILIDAYWAGNIKYGFVDRHAIIKPKHFPK